MRTVAPDPTDHRLAATANTGVPSTSIIGRTPSPAVDTVASGMEILWWKDDHEPHAASSTATPSFPSPGWFPGGGGGHWLTTVMATPPGSYTDEDPETGATGTLVAQGSGDRGWEATPDRHLKW